MYRFTVKILVTPWQVRCSKHGRHSSVRSGVYPKAVDGQFRPRSVGPALCYRRVENCEGGKRQSGVYLAEECERRPECHGGDGNVPVHGPVRVLGSRCRMVIPDYAYGVRRHAVRAGI